MGDGDRRRRVRFEPREGQVAPLWLQPDGKWTYNPKHECGPVLPLAMAVVMGEDTPDEEKISYGPPPPARGKHRARRRGWFGRGPGGAMGTWSIAS